MTKNEFTNITIGDKIVINTHGKNMGKMGIVREIRCNNDGPLIVYLEPIDCTFEFCHDYRRWQNKDGLYGWNRYGIGYPKKPVNKEFCVSVINEKEDDEVICWPAENFTSKELESVKRFLKELNGHVDMDTCAYINIEILDSNK